MARAGTWFPAELIPAVVVGFGGQVIIETETVADFQVVGQGNDVADGAKVRGDGFVGFAEVALVTVDRQRVAVDEGVDGLGKGVGTAAEATQGEKAAFVLGVLGLL